MYGDCDKKCKAAAALKKITKKAAARPKRSNVSNKHLANNVTSHLANNVTSE